VTVLLLSSFIVRKKLEPLFAVSTHCCTSIENRVFTIFFFISLAPHAQAGRGALLVLEVLRCKWQNAMYGAAKMEMLETIRMQNDTV
jgi:hypothetical protein